MHIVIKFTSYSRNFLQYVEDRYDMLHSTVGITHRGLVPWRSDLRPVA